MFFPVVLFGDVTFYLYLCRKDVKLMAKVLISFLGAATDGYKTANYRFSDGTVITSTFIAKALKDYYKIDKLILIGTGHSMWDEVYKSLGKKESDYDEPTFQKLKEICHASNHENNLMTEPYRQIVEKRIGGNSRVVIINYGLDETEIEENTKRIFHIDYLLKKNDTEIYLDASLLEQDKSGKFKLVAEEIRKFADIKNLNYLREYREAVGCLMPLTEKERLPKIGQMVIEPVMKQFVEKFPQEISLSKYQFRMAKWHKEHHNYGYALMVLVEAIVTYGCELCEVKDPTDRKKREYVKNALEKNLQNNEVKKKKDRLEKEFISRDGNFKAFTKEFKKVNEARNVIVHNSNNTNIKSYMAIIERLNNGITVFEEYIDEPNKK